MKTESASVSYPVATYKTVATFTIKLSVDEAAYLQAMINPNYFLGFGDMTDLDKEAYNFGLNLRAQLAQFVQENHPNNQ
jgi:hypothetical protein